jgi:hypothetical protein
MQRGWAVELSNGVILQEGDLDWRKVPKKQIVKLSLFFDGRSWHLTGKEAYFVKNRASVIPGIQDSFRIEERSIGYYEGSNKICYTVNELTGKFTLKVINTNE